MGGPLPQVREEVRWLHELLEGVQSVGTASAEGDDQGSLEAMRQLRMAGGLREVGQASVEVVRQQSLPAQGERVRNARFAKEWEKVARLGVRMMRVDV
jgi:hypothetical protein